MCLKQQILGQVTHKPTEVIRASTLRFPDINRGLDFLPQRLSDEQLTLTESQTSCGTLWAILSLKNAQSGFRLCILSSSDTSFLILLDLERECCCLYMLHAADLWRVVMKGESKDYIHASFANVRV